MITVAKPNDAVTWINHRSIATTFRVLQFASVPFELPVIFLSCIFIPFAVLTIPYSFSGLIIHWAGWTGSNDLTINNSSDPALFIESGRDWLRAPESAVDSSC